MKTAKDKKQILKKQKLIESVLEKSPDIIYQLDPDGKIIYINDNVRKYNYNAEDLIGKSIFDIVHPGDIERARWHVNERRTGERRTKSFEVHLLSAHSKIIPPEARKKEKNKNPVFLLDAEGLYDRNKPSTDAFLGTQAIARDISDKKMIEAQLKQAQKMEAIGLLAGGIVHDFNNLLTVVLGYSEVLLEDLKGNDLLYNKVKHIKNAGDSAKALTAQLLAYSRRQILKPEIVDLNSIVRKMEDMLRRVIKENIELKIDLDENLDVIKTDPNQMEQIIMNLVSNANDAMPKGGELVIKTSNMFLDEEFTQKNVGSTLGNFVRLSVSDTGVGMNDELKENIFDPFYTTKELGRGTGLGLAIVYGIIKQSNGNIWVQSAPEKGTVFDIYLPRTDEQLAAKKEADRFQKINGTETIMIVEDEIDIRELISRFLKERGYKILEASDGKAALEKFRTHKNPVHLLVTDVIMPHINGPQLAKRVLEKNPDIKILFMSGYADNIIAQMGVLDIDKEFIKKPFSPFELLYKINTILGH